MRQRRAPSAAQGSKQPADATKRDSLSKLARQLRKEVEDEGYTDMGPVLVSRVHTDCDGSRERR